MSEDQMRRTWALVDLLTSLKRRANHPPPTAELICRKFDALSLPALDTLSIVVDHAIAEQGRRLSPRQVCGMARAVRSFPEDTAAEVAHAHACGKVLEADATVEAARVQTSHLLRIGFEQSISIVLHAGDITHALHHTTGVTPVSYTHLTLPTKRIV